MQDSIYFFDQFRKAFMRELEVIENRHKITMINGRPDFNEICELRGCLLTIQLTRKVFYELEKQMKENLEKNGHL